MNSKVLCKWTQAIFSSNVLLMSRYLISSKQYLEISSGLDGRYSLGSANGNHRSPWWNLFLLLIYFRVLGLSKVSSSCSSIFKRSRNSSRSWLMKVNNADSDPIFDFSELLNSEGISVPFFPNFYS